MCRVLKIKHSSYYDWLSRDISEQQIHRNHCELLVKAAHSESKERYGYERLHATLTEQGHDITYIWTNEGWLYLAGVKDLYTKELVGYAINKRMTADLVCRALNMAIKNKRPSKELIVHSDRGSQYCSHAYHKIIKQHQFTGSMSGRGNCFDNAPIESFWGVLKNELVYHQDYITRFTAISDIIGYIELYYNQTRIQRGLAYKSPRQVWFDYYRQAA